MKEIKIQEIEGFKIGSAQNIEGATGCTVIIAPKGASAGVDVEAVVQPQEKRICLGQKIWFRRSMPFSYLGGQPLA